MDAGDAHLSSSSIWNTALDIREAEPYRTGGLVPCTYIDSQGTVPCSLHALVHGGGVSACRATVRQADREAAAAATHARQDRHTVQPRKPLHLLLALFVRVQPGRRVVRETARRRYVLPVLATRPLFFSAKLDDHSLPPPPPPRSATKILVLVTIPIIACANFFFLSSSSIPTTITTTPRRAEQSSRILVCFHETPGPASFLRLFDLAGSIGFLG